MSMTLTERIYELNNLIAEMQEKRNFINTAVDKAGKIKDAVKFLEENDESGEIAISINEYGYPAPSGGWKAYNLQVNRDDFYKFLKDQREKHLAAADKIAEELLEETKVRK